MQRKSERVLCVWWLNEITSKQDGNKLMMMIICAGILMPTGLPFKSIIFISTI